MYLYTQWRWSHTHVLPISSWTSASSNSSSTNTENHDSSLQPADIWTLLYKLHICTVCSCRSTLLWILTAWWHLTAALRSVAALPVAVLTSSEATWSFCLRGAGTGPVRAHPRRTPHHTAAATACQSGSIVKVCLWAFTAPIRYKYKVTAADSSLIRRCLFIPAAVGFSNKQTNKQTQQELLFCSLFMFGSKYQAYSD